MNVTITIADPTTRTDGSAVASSDLSSINVWRSSGSDPAVLVGTVSPLASPLVYVDANLAPGAYGYQVSATDKQTPPVTSDLSDVYPIVIPAALAAPSAPTIVSDSEA